MHRAWPLLGLALTLACGSAQADRLEDDFNTAWEAMWDQRGTPQRISRWDGPVVHYRVSGTDASEHHARIDAALRDAATISGVAMIDVTRQSDAPAQLEAVIVGDNELANNEPCVTSYRTRANWALEKVTIRMRRKDAWRCVHHEVMHAMGIKGHPSGKTVLGYLSGRRDAFLEVDVMMLRAWYAPAMALGATPLEAMAVLGDAAASNPELGLAAPEARQRVDAFMRTRIEQLQALAKGVGGVPSIVIRSGKASEPNMRNASRDAAYYLGLAGLRGTGMAKDEAAAGAWFKLAAEAGHSPSQVLWGRALAAGAGVSADPSAAYAWFARAAGAGNAAAKADMERLEKTLTPTELEQARAASAVKLATQ